MSRLAGTPPVCGSGVGTAAAAVSVAAPVAPPGVVASDVDEGPLKASENVEPTGAPGATVPGVSTTLTSRPTTRGARANVHVLPSAARTPCTDPVWQATLGFDSHGPPCSLPPQADPAKHAAITACAPPWSALSATVSVRLGLDS